MQNPSRPEAFIGSARVVFLMTLASRVLGMVRDSVAAASFGVSEVWDAFLMAFLIPNLFRRLFGEGALSSAFVPVFVDHLERQGKPAAGRLLSALTTWATVILTLLTAAGIAVAWAIPRFSDDPQTARICGLLTILLPFMILICLVAIFSSALNSLRRFGLPALVPTLLNVCMIGAMVLTTGTEDLRVRLLAAVVLLAGVLEVAVLWWPLRQAGLCVTPTLASDLPGLHEVRRLFLPAVLGAGLLQISEVLDQVIAQIFVGPGGVSSLVYAERIAFLPLSLVAVALGTAALPTLARAAVYEDRSAFDAALSRGLRLALFLSVPAAVGLMMLPEMIVRVLYERQAFGPHDTVRVGLVLFWYAAGLVFFTLNQIFVRAFHARKDTATPFRLMAVTALLNLALNVLLVRTPLREAGLALATSICGLLNAAMLGTSLRRRHGVRVERGVLTTAAATLLIGALTVPVLLLVKAAPMPSEPARLGACVGAGIGMTFVLGWGLCRQEMRDILGLRG